MSWVSREICCQCWWMQHGASTSTQTKFHYSMWNKVAQMALEQSNFFVAQRSFAALNDYPRARAAFRMAEMAEAAAKEIGSDGTQYYKVRAAAAQLTRKFKDAERIYMEQNAVEEAIEMYQLLQKWEEALELAKAALQKWLLNVRSAYVPPMMNMKKDE